MESTYFRTNSARKGELLNTQFTRKEEDRLQQINEITGPERHFHAHDAIHSLVSAKLSAYGVRFTPTASVANEILTLGLEHGSKHAKPYRPDKITQFAQGVRVLVQEHYGSQYDPVIFEPYVRQLTNLLFQSVWLERRIYTLEGPGFRQHLDLVHSTLEETGLEDGESSEVSVEYQAEVAFKAAAGTLVARINRTLDTLEKIESNLPVPSPTI